jgi:hypothetical protein
MIHGVLRRSPIDSLEIPPFHYTKTPYTNSHAISNEQHMPSTPSCYATPYHTISQIYTNLFLLLYLNLSFHLSQPLHLSLSLYPTLFLNLSNQLQTLPRHLYTLINHSLRQRQTGSSSDSDRWRQFTFTLSISIRYTCSRVRVWEAIRMRYCLCLCLPLCPIRI